MTSPSSTMRALWMTVSVIGWLPVRRVRRQRRQVRGKDKATRDIDVSALLTHNRFNRNCDDATANCITSPDDRYAIYWAPDAAHPLWAAGCAWLDADTSVATDVARQPPHPNVATPARYGFHATLKAPFRLAAGRSLQDLRRAAAALAAQHRDFEMPCFRKPDGCTTSSLCALCRRRIRRIRCGCWPTLASDDLDEFRAPAPPANRRGARPKSTGNASAQALRARWGYAHVFDGWRFHMTLSDRFADRGSNAARQLEHDARGVVCPQIWRQPFALWCAPHLPRGRARVHPFG